jgi:hypothetical protein
VPTWVDIVKTGAYKELAPYDPDWYYVRAGMYYYALVGPLILAYFMNCSRHMLLLYSRRRKAHLPPQGRRYRQAHQAARWRRKPREQALAPPARIGLGAAQGLPVA